MSAATIGWIAAGLIVALASALVISRRPLPRYGDVQSYSLAARVMVAASAFLFLVAAPAVFLTAHERDVKVWIGCVLCLCLGLGLLVVLYYYTRFSVRVMPDSITITDPFRGTFTITETNLVAAHETRFKGASQTRFVFMDGETQRSITLAHRVVSLGAIFYLDEEQAFATITTYVDTFATNRQRISVGEGHRSDGIAIQPVHGKYLITYYEMGQKYFEIWEPDRTQALAIFVRLFERDEGNGCYGKDIVSPVRPEPLFHLRGYDHL